MNDTEGKFLFGPGLRSISKVIKYLLVCIVTELPEASSLINEDLRWFNFNSHIHTNE